MATSASTNWVSAALAQAERPQSAPQGSTGVGALAFLAGGIGLCFALNSDTAVGGINNLGLMQDKQLYVILSIALMFIGLIVAISQRRSG